jgi:hypothetical protein
MELLGALDYLIQRIVRHNLSRVSLGKTEHFGGIKTTQKQLSCIRNTISNISIGWVIIKRKGRTNCNQVG